MATEGVSDVHYYKSTMTGAPNLYSGTGTARINAIVKACLIDGFGSEAPQGSWQVAYSKSGVIALQSTELADRPLLRIDDYGPQWAYLRAYETMSSIDSGVNPFPTIAQSANGGEVQKSDYTGTNPRPWTLFADSRSVFFFCDNANNGVWSNGFYFGDGVLYNPDDLFFL